MSDYSDGEADTPSRKTPNRPKTRTIIRWTDEKLIMAFAEFRLAAQRHRIDIKKPLDDCAKAIAPTCTADALIQQLTKRRNRFIKETENPIMPPPALLNGTPKSTPKRRRTLIKGEDTNTPSSSGLNTSPALVPATRNVTRAKLKEELGLGETTTPDKKSPYVFQDFDSDSDYTDSPIKDKKKRVPKKKKRVFEVEQVSDDDYVDQAGGIYSVVKKATPPPPMQTDSSGMAVNLDTPRCSSQQTTATTFGKLGDMSVGHGGYGPFEKHALINGNDALGPVQGAGFIPPQNLMAPMSLPFNMMNGGLINPGVQGMATYGGMDTSGIPTNEHFALMMQMMMAQSQLPTGVMSNFPNPAFGSTNFMSGASRMGTEMESAQYPKNKLSEAVESSAYPARASEVSKHGESFNTISSEASPSHDSRHGSPVYRRSTPRASHFSTRTGLDPPDGLDAEYNLFDGRMSADPDDNDTPRKKLADQFDDFDMS